MIPAGIQRAIGEYAELEMEIDRLVKQRLYGVCAACEKPCCRADVGQEAVSSWWLRQVSRHVHGKWWPDDWETRQQCVALTEAGCKLTAGRPAICRSFVCEKYTEAYGDLWEAIFFSFVADLLGEVTRVSSRVDLAGLDADDVPRYAKAIAERIAAARRQLDLAKGLLEADVEPLQKHRIALKLLCSVPRFLRATTRRAILARLE